MFHTAAMAEHMLLRDDHPKDPIPDVSIGDLLQ